MKAMIEIYKKGTHEVGLYYSHQFSGHGHWKVKCEVTFRGENKSFTSVTTDSQFIDKIQDPDLTWDDKQAAYHGKFFDQVEEAVSEWVDDVFEQ